MPVLVLDREEEITLRRKGRRRTYLQGYETLEGLGSDYPVIRGQNTFNNNKRASQRNIRLERFLTTRGRLCLRGCSLTRLPLKRIQSTIEDRPADGTQGHCFPARDPKGFVVGQRWTWQMARDEVWRLTMA